MSQSKQQIIFSLIGLLLLVSGLFFLRTFHIFGIFPKQDSALTDQPKTSPPTKTSIMQASYLISGDVFWGRGIDYFAQQSPLKYDWPFSRLSEFNPDKYDGWIADIECPVTDKKIPYQVQVDSLIFACSPDYLPAASKWFDVFTLANNHTSNTGPDGFADTRTNLAKAGRQFFGHWDLSQRQDLCEVIALKVKVDSQAKKLPIAMCGYHWLARMPSDDELAQISQYAAYFPVWVFPHGGTEYSTVATPAQQELYRKMIDLGADAVFADHPHVVEPTEAYKGKLIVYNLGNLIFDQWFDQEVTKSLIVNVALSASVDKNLQAYLDMGESCAVFKDNCLETAQTKGLKAYKLKYSYSIIAGDSSNASSDDRLKHLGSPTVQEWLLKRTNWPTTLSGLN
ncbi:CapA family protein [Candidatus Saccharibacteria bacterium]|nr:CapA family protein [Candidatus Saccharibacteria bacterium]